MAVRSLQKASQLDVDGVVGPKTWAALGQSSAAGEVAGEAFTLEWMKIAIAEFGVHEYSKEGKHNKRILEYHATTTLGAKTDEIPWCSSFVNWVMIQAGFRGTNDALAKSWIDWGIDLKTPRKGAIVVIKRKGKKLDRATGSSTGFHVAFLESVTKSKIRLLGGNQGNRVKYSNYYFDSYEVQDYRWPFIRTFTKPPMHIYVA
jgi:uncharacterized protein (TIGR02594 family)